MDPDPSSRFGATPFTHFAAPCPAPARRSLTA
jgi:hypothetical protein